AHGAAREEQPRVHRTQVATGRGEQPRNHRHGEEHHMKVDWRGVIPAITTPFNADLSIDHEFFARHARWMVDAGCVGIVPFGSLGEAATLTTAEKLHGLEILARELDGVAPVIPAISALSTREAVEFTLAAE